LLDKDNGDAWPKMEGYSNYPEEDYREEPYQGETSWIDNP